MALPSAADPVPAFTGDVYIAMMDYIRRIRDNAITSNEGIALSRRREASEMILKEVAAEHDVDSQALLNETARMLR